MLYFQLTAPGGALDNCLWLWFLLPEEYFANLMNHWCSVGTEKTQPEGPPFQWEKRLVKFPTVNGGPESWDFSETTKHQ